MKKIIFTCPSEDTERTADKITSGDGLCYSPAPRDGTEDVEGFIADSKGTEETDVRKDSVSDRGLIICTAAVAVCALLFSFIFGPTPKTLRLTAMCAILSSASLRDIRTRHVPDSHAIMLLLISTGGADTLRDLLIPYTGALLLFITLAAIRLILKRESIGGADVKIVSAMAALLGIRTAASAFALSLLLSVIFVSAVNKINKKTARTGIPLIPYLFASTVITVCVTGLIGK